MTTNMRMGLMKMIIFVQAEKMAKKADAWKEYKEAAMVDMMLQTLPKVIWCCWFWFEQRQSRLCWFLKTISAGCC